MFPHQLQALKTKQRFAVWVWHRKARKTTTAIEKLNIEAHLKKDVYWYVSPSYRLARETIWKDPKMLFRVIDDRLIEKSNDTEMTIYYKYGSILSIMGADRPDLLRGPNPRGVVIDEFSIMKANVWDAVIQPIMRTNPEAWCWFLFTPKGKNHAYRTYLRGQETGSQWKSWLLPVTESGVLTEAQIETAREEMPSALFGQEFMCDFLEAEGAVFKNVRSIMTAEPQKPIKDHLYVMGVDLAKARDYTVLAVYDRHTNSQVYQERFKQIEWPFQKAKIKATAKHYNNALIVMDASGVGDPICDDLLRENLAVEPYKFTQPSKKELVEKLSIWVQQQKIKLLPIEVTLNEFENFSIEIGPTGRISYRAPEGFHDDIVIAHGLAIWSLQPLFKEEKKKRPSLIRVKFLKDVGKWSPDYDEAEEEYEKEWLQS